MVDVENKIVKTLKLFQKQGKETRKIKTFEWIKKCLEASARFLRLVCLTKVKKKIQFDKVLEILYRIFADKWSKTYNL